VKTNEQTTIKLIQLLLKWEYHEMNNDVGEEKETPEYPIFNNIILSYNYVCRIITIKNNYIKYI